MKASSLNQQIHGFDSVPPEPLMLRAGPLTLQYDQGDLRNVRLGNRLVLLRLYAAVRDKNWATVPAVLTLVEQRVQETEFQIVYEAEHRQGDIHFVWRGTLTGLPDG